MESLWKLSLSINKKAENIVLEKFNKYLLDFCEKENIKIQYFDEIVALNNTLQKYDENHLAVGIYSREVDSNKNLVINSESPSIKLLKDYNIFTFAHEIGHHLAIKNFKDREEDIADHFILLLAEEFLTNIERYIISISIKVCSGINFPLPKIKRKDWRNFKKEHNFKKCIKDYSLFKNIVQLKQDFTGIFVLKTEKVKIDT
jgi:hypothetical protein